MDVTRASAPSAWTARIQLPTGARVALHSARDPLAEAHRQLAAVVESSPETVVFVGAGLGFVTEAARARWPSARLIVVEPSPALARHALARTPSLYEIDGVQVRTGPDFGGPDQLWRLFDRIDVSEPQIVVHPTLARAMPAEMKRAAAFVHSAIRAGRMNAAARREHAGRYVRNTLCNLPHIVDGPDAGALAGRFTAVPAIIVAAGPSLDSNLPELHSVADRALIIAADTAWRPLVFSGIDPAFVVAVDPSESNGRHLTGVSPRRDTWILAEGSVDPVALRAHAARVATFRIGDHHPWPWLGRIGAARHRCRVWGSVLTAAVDLALIAGCDPIVFVGADLAYTDERPYCRGTSFEELWMRYAAQGVSLRRIWRNTIAARAVLTASDVHGRPAMTAPHLLEFRNWVVRFAQEHSGRRFINATGAGILVGEGIHQSTLEAVLGDRPKCAVNIVDLMDRVFGARADTSRARHEMASLLASLPHALKAAAPAQATAAPVAEWLTFGAPSLTLEDVSAALTASCKVLAAPRIARPLDTSRSETGAAAPSLAMHPADRVARMRALLAGSDDALDGVSHRAPRSERQRQSAEAAVLPTLRQLLELPSPIVAAIDEEAASAGDVSAAPLSRRFVWTPPAAPLIARFEELLIDASWRPRIAGDRPASFWRSPISPVLDGADDSEGPTTHDIEAILRLSLSHEWLESRHERDDSVSRRRQRLANAIIQGASDPALHPKRAAAYDLAFCHAAAHEHRLPARIDALMRALTGTIVWRHANDSRTIRNSHRAAWPGITVRSRQPDPMLIEPRLVFLGETLDYIEPEVLSHAGVPPSWVCATQDNEHAIVTPAGSTHSLRVDATGASRPWREWPEAITGEVSWGRAGSALAWNRKKRLLFCRPNGETDKVAVTAVPFQPLRVATGPDDVPYWCGVEGGVWACLPGAPSRLIVETLPCAGPRFEDDTLWLDPLLRDAADGVIRRRAISCWRYDAASGVLHEHAIDPAGQCPLVKTHAGWCIRCYGFTDLIRLTTDDGRMFELACYAPVDAAWAGGSLIVTTADGCVLLFRDLKRRLDRRGHETVGGG